MRDEVGKRNELQQETGADAEGHTGETLTLARKPDAGNDVFVSIPKTISRL